MLPKWLKNEPKIEPSRQRPTLTKHWQALSDCTSTPLLDAQVSLPKTAPEKHTQKVNIKTQKRLAGETFKRTSKFSLITNPTWELFGGVVKKTPTRFSDFLLISEPLLTDVGTIFVNVRRFGNYLGLIWE